MNEQGTGRIVRDEPEPIPGTGESVPHAGPAHDRDCLGRMNVLGSPTGHGHCSCPRAEWLGDLVPRGQARAELLDQLAGWAREQSITARAVVESIGRQEQHHGTIAAAAGVRAAVSIGDQVWSAVRVGAVALARECRAHMGTSDTEEAKADEH